MSSCASTGTQRGSALNGGVQGEIGLTFSNPNVPLTNCFRGTLGGDFVVFWTDGRLTSDDPSSPTTADVYAYDLTAEELTRVSAPQGGAGLPAPCGTDSAASLSCYGDLGGALGSSQQYGTNLPSLNVPTNPQGATERVLYFQSRSQLVADDIDTSYDVYEWHDGELSLISTGDSDRGGAFYYGSSRDGRNVYIGTRDDLSWQDIDDVGDVYTARIDGGIEEPVLPPPCDVLADLCQGATSVVPAATGASSAVFSGEGNLVAKPNSRRPKKRCGKNRVRRGKKCVARKAARKSRTANQTGRASR